MQKRPTIEECNICSKNYAKQIKNLKEGIDELHYAINKMFIEYTRLHMEERALEEIQDLCLNENVLEVKEDLIDVNENLSRMLNRIKKICKKIKIQKEEIEKAEKNYVV